ncbi:MAG: 2'-5' RNA ligase family protein [Actinomycetota bacterium]
MPPHITLLYPWRSSPVSGDDLAAAAAAFGDVAAFDLRFGHLARFPDVVYLVPEPVEVLRGLMERAAAAFPDTPPYEGIFTDVVPHLTVVKVDPGVPLDDLEREIASVIAPELPFRMRVSEICIDEPGVAPKAEWFVRARIPLS